MTAPTSSLPLAGGRRATSSTFGTVAGPGRVAAYAAVVVLTLLALGIRAAPLDQPDGGLNTDEARLGLAADGVLATGLPILPSGRLYTRGLVTTYAIAPSFVLFGRHDWSARLPSALAGALLVPLTFVFARRLADRASRDGGAVTGLGAVAGLAAAGFVAVADPLLVWSQQAWPPAIFLLCFVGAAYAAYRGFGQDEPRWQPIAGLLFTLALLAYEFALLLPLALGPYLLLRLAHGDRRWWHGRPTLGAFGIATLAVALFAAMGLALRAGTLAGADAEFRHYFTPGLGLNGARFYLRSVWGPYVPLLAVVVVALPWTLGLAGHVRDDVEPKPRAAPGLVLLLLLAAVAVPAFGIQRKWEVHYGLAVLPLVALAAAQGAAALTGPLGRVFGSPARLGQPVAPSTGLGRTLAGAVLCAALFFAVRQDVRDLLAPPPPTSTGPTWLDELRALGWRPNDLLFAEGPLVTQFYLGAADFYVQPDGYERYARPDGLLARSLYTNAVLLKEPGDFVRLVAEPHAGRVLWVVGRDDRLPRLTRQMDPAVWAYLQERSGVTRPTSTGWWLMRVELAP